MAGTTRNVTLALTIEVLYVVVIMLQPPSICKLHHVRMTENTSVCEKGFLMA